MIRSAFFTILISLFCLSASANSADYQASVKNSVTNGSYQPNVTITYSICKKNLLDCTHPRHLVILNNQTKVLAHFSEYGGVFITKVTTIDGKYSQSFKPGCLISALNNGITLKLGIAKNGNGVLYCVAHID